MEEHKLGQVANLMFTFRGIPCIYYGTEIEFQKDKQVEPYEMETKSHMQNLDVRILEII